MQYLAWLCLRTIAVADKKQLRGEGASSLQFQHSPSQESQHRGMGSEYLLPPQSRAERNKAIFVAHWLAYNQLDFSTTVQGLWEYL